MRAAPLLLLLFAACRSEPSDDGTIRGAGDPYRIVLAPAEAEPDQPPGLDGDTLVVRVRYSGGCESHDFDLDADVRGDTTFLVIEHDAHGDGCEADVYDELRLGLPDDVARTGLLLLRNPQGGPAYRIGG